ncbi:MAG: hypothetical protein HY827_03765 [Actinobacteria bacterium]|nr:hypothetical protein [Actinomycetota bacterium]
MLVERLLAVHDALTAAKLPHAFGGAIALAYCTQEPRGTRDLDVNIFTDSGNAREALAALPAGVAVSAKDVDQVLRDGQARLWWDETPVDVFLNNHPYHRKVAKSVRWVPLAGRDIPVLNCASLVVFKALFNRTKDWADIEAIVESDAEGPADALAALREMLGPQDPLADRLARLLDDSDGDAA